MKTTFAALIILLTALSAAAQIQFLSPWWIATGTSSDTCALGSSIVGLGDINSDGYDDFAAGTSEGRVWIFLGSQQPDSIPDLYINNPDTTVEYFGWGLWDIGDINGDGYADILIYSQTRDYPNPIKLFIYFAGTAFDTIPDLVLGSPLLGRWMTEAKGIGDFNGDGGNDFAITDNSYPIPGTAYEGRMQVFFGGSALDSIPDWEITADSTRNRFPEYCCGLGDLNGDGCTEIAAGEGACTGLNGIPYSGLVEIYFGSTPPDTIPDWQRYGIANEGFGTNIIALDINHDGYKELGAYSANPYPPGYTFKILF